MAIPTTTLTQTQQIEIAKCMTGEAGFLYFLETYVQIEDQEKGVIPFEIWPCHLDIIYDLFHEQYISILKARQIGMSWLLGAAYPLWLCIFHPNKLAMVFSWRDDEAAEIIAKARFVWAKLPDWMKPALKPDNAMELGFAGLESRIKAFPSKPDAGSGYTASYVLSDEHAKQPYAAEQYSAIRPTIEHGGQFVSCSTAKGGGTFHQKLWSSARDGLNGFKARFFPYNARPGRDRKWWDRTHQSWMEEEIKFFQEYPRTPEEAVQFSVPRFFPVESISEPTASFADPLPPAAVQNKELRRLVMMRPSLATAGIRIYQEPDERSFYVIGADVAQGIGGDRQAAVVLDALTGDEVAVIHGNWPITTYANIIFKIAQEYRALICPERNNHGHALIIVLQQLIQRAMQSGKRVSCQMYYEKPTLDRRSGRMKPQQVGWNTGAASKAVLYDGLFDAILAAEVGIASTAVLGELRSVVKDPDDGKIGAEQGYHDDLVIALAIAWQMVLYVLRTRRKRTAVPFGMGQHADTLADEASQRFTRKKPGREQGEVLSVTYPEKRPTILQRIQTKLGRGGVPW